MEQAMSGTSAANYKAGEARLKKSMKLFLKLFFFLAPSKQKRRNKKWIFSKIEAKS